MKPRRLSSYSAPAPFVSRPDLQRLTFVDVDGREPVYQGTPPTFAVVVWPMNGNGYMDEAAVLRGEARITTWTPSAAELTRLLELVADEDVAPGEIPAVGGGRVIPQLESMRRSEYMPAAVTA